MTIGLMTVSITTEVDAHFFRFGNIQMQKIVTAPTRETYHCPLKKDMTGMRQNHSKERVRKPHKLGR